MSAPMYAVSARVQMIEGNNWSTAISLPTFYLLADVQGITNEAHAEKIVRDMLERLGHNEVSIQVCGTSAHAHDGLAS